MNYLKPPVFLQIILPKALSAGLVAALLTTSFIASAQTETAPNKSDIAKPDCKKPEYPGKFASDSRIKSFQKTLDAYKNCVKAYADEHQAQGKAHLDAAQTAIEEYNALVRQIQVEQGVDEK